MKVDQGYRPFWTRRAELRSTLARLLSETGRDPVLAFQGAEEDWGQILRLHPSVASYVARAK